MMEGAGAQEQTKAQQDRSADVDDDGGVTFGVGYQQQPEVTEIERQGKGKTPKLQTDTKAGGRPY